MKQIKQPQRHWISNPVKIE